MSSTVDKAGDVAEGDTITIPLANATCCKIAVVTPEQSAPIKPLTLSEVISLSAAAVAAEESMQVESALIPDTFPIEKLPDLLTSSIASSAPAAMSGVRLSIGPVNPIIIPNFTSEKDAVVVRHNARSVVINFFISFSQIFCSLNKKRISLQDQSIGKLLFF